MVLLVWFALSIVVTTLWGLAAAGTRHLRSSSYGSDHRTAYRPDRVAR